MKAFIVAMAVFASVATSHAQSVALWGGFVYPSMEHFKQFDGDIDHQQCRSNMHQSAAMITSQHPSAHVTYNNDDWLTIEMDGTIFVVACAPRNMDLRNMIAEIYRKQQRHLYH